MDLIGGISAATEAIKLTKELRGIDREIDKAELKLRLVEVIDRLLEAKEALQDAREEQRTLESKIKELEAVLAQRKELRDENGLLYELDKEDRRTGEPYCNLCYVKHGKLFRMRHSAARMGVEAQYRCDNCNTSVATGPALPIPIQRTNSGSWM